MTDAAKAARAAYHKKWAKENRERLNAYHKKWAKENPEKVKAIDNRYWERKAQTDAAQASTATD